LYCVCINVSELILAIIRYVLLLHYISFVGKCRIEPTRG